MSNYNNTKCKCDHPEFNECGNEPKNCCLHCDCGVHDNKDCKRNKRLEEKKIEFNIKLNYFDISEFECPCEKGSGKKMDLNLLMILDNMRHRAKIPFKITSGYRCQKYNDTLKNSSKNSAHCLGKAVDISAPTSKQKYLIIEAALHFGIQRVGVGSNFIHIDIQEENEKPTKVIWTY